MIDSLVFKHVLEVTSQIVGLIAIVVSLLTAFGVVWLKFHFDRRFEEFRIRFDKLHEKRLDTIAITYRHLIRTEQAFFNLVKPFTFGGEPSKDKKIKLVNEAAREFLVYFNENKIYFDEPLCLKIDDFFEKIRDSWDNLQEIGDSVKNWSELWKNSRDDLLSIRKDIENEFRSLLGVKTSRKTRGPAPPS